MAWNATNPVTVGAATKKDHYDRVFDNVVYVHGLFVVGFPYSFGGAEPQGNVGTGYPSGATYAALVPWSGILYVPDCSVFSGVTMVLEAMLRAEAGATATLALFNLTDGTPDAALANSEITSTDATGARVRTSSAITLPTSGAKAFGIKLHSASAALQAWAWQVRIFPGA